MFKFFFDTLKADSADARDDGEFVVLSAESTEFEMRVRHLLRVEAFVQFACRCGKLHVLQSHQHTHYLFCLNGPWHHTIVWESQRLQSFQQYDI